eukprot:7583-Pelagomonas_calceolata.AAC.3
MPLDGGDKLPELATAYRAASLQNIMAGACLHASTQKCSLHRAWELYAALGRPNPGCPTPLLKAFQCFVHPSQAVTEFGRQGGTVNLQLDASSPISLANVTWSTDAQQDRFSSGSLTIEGHAPPNGGSKQAVLDAAMRSKLAPEGFSATMILQVSVPAASACASQSY